MGEREQNDQVLPADQEKLTKVVSVRFTEAEVEVLASRAGGRPLSHLVRQLCMEAVRSNSERASRTVRPAQRATRTNALVSLTVRLMQKPPEHCRHSGVSHP